MLSLNEYARLVRWWMVYLGKRRDITLPTQNGLLSFSSKDWLIGKYLSVKRGHEIGEIERALKLLWSEGYLDLNSEGVVVNLGAHIGMTCIALLREGWFQHAVVFEPAPESFRLLLRNIQQNNLQERIRAFPLAISSAPGETELELSASNSGDHRIRQHRKPGFFDEEKRAAIKVPVDSLDHFFENWPDLNGDSIRLLWLDAQGHEGYILDGGRQLLRRRVPVITEFWPYGIDRSGMSEGVFHSVAAGLFTHFYVIHDASPAPHAIDDLHILFREYAGPRQVCMLALVNEGLRGQGSRTAESIGKEGK